MADPNLETHQAMKLEEFITAIETMVLEWQPEDPQAGATHRGALTAIYSEMREQMAHDLAEAVRQREKALALLHGHYTVQPRAKPRRGRPPKL